MFNSIEKKKKKKLILEKLLLDLNRILPEAFLYLLSTFLFKFDARVDGIYKIQVTTNLNYDVETIKDIKIVDC